MDQYAVPINILIEELSRLPGIGRKTAQRLAFFILNMESDQVVSLARSIIDAKKNIKFCSICGNMTENDICNICLDDKRNKSIICVVEDSRDVMALEKTKEYKGLYHVLQGNISPVEGIGPQDINIKGLITRLNNDIQEIVIATNPTIEGEATAMYISRIVNTMKILVTRIAYGIPIGGDIEYIDEITLIKAFEGRRKI